MNAAHSVVVHFAPRLVVHTGDLAATLLGALGVALALASLGWQAFTFIRSGSRIKVVLRSGATDGMTSVVTSVGPLTVEQLNSLQQQGLRMPVYGVEVVNSGRGSTSVTTVDIAFSNGAAYSGAYVAGSPQLPFRLDGETEQSWHFDAHLVNSLAVAWEQTQPTGSPHVIRGRVRVAGRAKPILSKNGIRVL